MIALLLLVALLLSPLIFWLLGLKILTIISSCVVGFSLSSIAKVIYPSIKHRQLPKIGGDPSIVLASKRIGF